MFTSIPDLESNSGYILSSMFHMGDGNTMLIWKRTQTIVFLGWFFFSSFCHLDIYWSPLERGNLSCVIALRRLACVQICRGISWWMIDVRGSSQLWAVPVLGKGLHWRRKQTEQVTESQPVSSVPWCFQFQFRLPYCFPGFSAWWAATCRSN